MQDDILALAKFNLPVQKWRMTTVQQVNGKFTFLLFSRVHKKQWNLQFMSICWLNFLLVFPQHRCRNHLHCQLHCQSHLNHRQYQPHSCLHSLQLYIQLPRRNKRALSLLLFVFCSFLWIITFLFLCGWRRHTVKITPHFALSGFQEQNSWRDRHMFLWMQMQYKISAVDNLKIEPAFIIPHVSRWRPKLWIYRDKSQIILYFLEVTNGRQLVRTQVTHKKI